MTLGITQADVFAAADRLLAAGERPTVERVRTAIGSGSPNTIIRHLDAWWADAGLRLRAKAELPNVPAPIAELAAALWAHAVESATQHAQTGIAQAHAEIAVERESLVAKGEGYETERQRLAAALTHSEQTIASQTVQLEAWAARAGDWESERTRTLIEAERLNALLVQSRNDLNGLRDQHAALQRQAEQDRLAAAEHIRTVEDRAHAVVDAVRQELKALRLQANTLQRDVTRLDEARHRERAAHAKSLATAERQLAAAQAKGLALEGALATFKSSLGGAVAKKATSRPRKTTPRKLKTER